MATPPVELQSIQSSARQQETDPESAPQTPQSSAASLTDAVPEGHQEFSLPPADGGKDAWLFLAACFVMEVLVWGFPFAFGVFNDYYRTHEPFAGSPGTAIIGTCSLGIMYLDTPLVFAVQRLYPRATRWAPSVGLICMCLSLAASSFSQTLTHLIITQGVLYAIFGSICYCPCILYLDEWFIHRKGLAYGVMWGGTGTGGFIFPLLLEHFLGKYGFRTTLRIWATALFVLAIPLMYFIKPRLPSSASTNVKPYKLAFLWQPTFLLYQTASIIESAGYFLPSIYLPSYARTTLGAGSVMSALTVLLLNVASAIGLVVMGTFVDRFHVTTCILISTVGAVLGTFFLWGFATNLAVLYTFCLVYGFFAGSYVSAWPGIIQQVVAEGAQRYDSSGARSMCDPMMVFGFLGVGRGIGNVASGPLSETLMRGLPWKGKAAGAWGSGYGTLIAFTGTTAVIGGASFVCKRAGWIR